MRLLSRDRVAVIGGGPVGSLLAAYLAGRGCEVDVYERRSDMRRVDIPAGRSINLVLTERGLRALELLDIKSQVLELTVPVTGRMTHGLDGGETFLRYGKDDSECNYSVSRGELNIALLDVAERAGARLHFDAALEGVDVGRDRLLFGSGDDQHEVDVSGCRVFGCEGAPSPLRAALAEQRGFRASIELIEHGYKELSFPAAPDGGYAMAGHALHIWARGDHFLMGLPNRDGSFTGTIYLRNDAPADGSSAADGEAASFGALDDAEAVTRFFERHYRDALPLISGLPRSLLEAPLGTLGTVRCDPWHLEDRYLLVGDAAHGVVPFFGQGLNCGFEDCAVLAELLDSCATLTEAFASYTARRKPAGDAIADMALENFVEMRDRVRDPQFLLRKAVEARIEAAYPERYRSRYAMVMYSSIPYHHARQAGLIQQQILGELCRGIERPEQADLERAAALIAERLTPFFSEHDVSLDF